jgi:hypothetical protein
MTSKRTPASKPASAPVTVAEAATLPATPGKARKPRTARLSVAVADGSVALYLRRSSGKERHVPYIPKADRPAVAALRDAAKERTLPVVAGEQGLSLSTLRRRLLALDASEQVDAGAFDALWTPGEARVVFTRGGAE